MLSAARLHLLSSRLSPTVPFSEWDMHEGVYRHHNRPLANFDEWFAAVGGTYSRSGTRRYFGADQLLATASANVWPTEYNPKNGYLIGKSSWPAVSTRITGSGRDLTGWTATNCTVVKDQVGIDGAANVASSLLATSNNATVLQAITDATSRERGFVAFPKRLIGTGTIEMTWNGGTTWVDVTAELATTGYAWLVVSSTSNIANPSVGFRIGTSGDKIAVDYCSCTDHRLGGPPLLVGESTSIDLANIPLSKFPLFNFKEGQVCVKAVSNLLNTGSAVAVSIDDGSNQEILLDIQRAANGGISCSSVDGGVSQAQVGVGTGGVGWIFRDSIWASVRYGTNNFRAGSNGSLGTQDTACTLATPNNIRIGRDKFDSAVWGSGISGMRFYNRAPDDLQSIPASCHAYTPDIIRGDSLSSGTGASSVDKAWLWLIRRRNIGIRNFYSAAALGGTTSAQSFALAQSEPWSWRHPHIIWTGQNRATETPAQTLANIQAIVALLGHGKYLVLNMAASPGNDGVADITTLNGLIAAAFPNNYVDIYGAMVAGGGDYFDEPDITHPNDAGQIIVANAVIAKLNLVGF